MGLHPVAGSKIYIGRRVAAREEVVVSDFYGSDWTEIKGWTQAGSLGDTQETVTQASISQQRAQKAKGTLNAGRMDNTFKPIAADPGQIRFKRAIESCANYEFKIEWSADCDSEITPADLFYGLALPGAKAGGEANASQLRSWAVEIDSNIVEDTDGGFPPILVVNENNIILD